jgi:hypothetical protein
MNLNKKKLFLMSTVLIVALGTLLGQTTYDLNFQGILTDIQGNCINNEPFNLLVQLRPESEQEVLFEFSSSTKTDEEGWFGYPINDISRHIMEDGKISKTVVIRMEFLPNDKTTWIKDGDDFMVTYKVEPVEVDKSIQLKITRMEGSELVVHKENHLFAFKDQYPFAYLTGGFLITDNPPVGDQSIADLRQWLTPDDSDEDGAGSRGVKGGFPAGGYYKKN